MRTCTFTLVLGSQNLMEDGQLQHCSQETEVSEKCRILIADFIFSNELATTTSLRTLFLIKLFCQFS